MCDEPFEETILIADTGAVFIRRDHNSRVYLGLSELRDDDTPDVLVRLAPRQLSVVVDELSADLIDAAKDAYDHLSKIGWPEDKSIIERLGRALAKVGRD